MSASPALARSLAAAAGVLGQVLSGASLSAALERVRRHDLRAAAQDLSFNALREHGLLDALLERQLERPLRQDALRGLLLAALAELAERPQQAHAVVHQAVEACAMIGRPQAKGLVNAVLRNFQRRGRQLRAEIESTEPGRYWHPQWWIDRVRSAYPEAWQQVLLAANTRPPMTLRVNRRRTGVQKYLERLAAEGMAARAIGAAAVLLERPCRVEALPGFAEGLVSVQDAGAQAAAPLLDARAGMRVLDACAAPGGKTAHLLELCDCEVLALDASRERMPRIRDNLSRLGLSAEVKVGDATAPQTFWDGRPFERILADVPCSASGVARRHPDIKWLRRSSDIAAFAEVQARMLEALWQLLAPDGKFLYATCSVFPEENGLQVRTFLDRHPEAQELPLEGLGGGQILPGPETDGFYYALLRKVRA